MDEIKRKKYGAFETPAYIFKKYILPEIKSKLYDYIWVDMYCGSGNLILPILEEIPDRKRIDFFKEHIFMYDVLPEMVEEAIRKAYELGIPEDVARANIKVRDVLRDFPSEILKKDLPVFHITNPPYMYIGYIRKSKEYQLWLQYFKGSFEGLQDIYQLALMNDLLHGILRAIYVIPTNFLYGASVSNKIRKEFLYWYEIEKAIIFEKKIFEHTGQHVGIFFFGRKKNPSHTSQTFKLVKIDEEIVERTVVIGPVNNYRAGFEFEEFVSKYRAPNPIKVNFYLFLNDVINNPGSNKIIAVDSNAYNGKEYFKKVFYVNNQLYEKIKKNILFVKTLDGARETEKAGLYIIKEVFDADCIIVSRAPYRTHPIQIFFEPELSLEEQILLRDYFNLLLNYFRDLTDGEFMTTYKYSDAPFTRKYLGLTQVKKLIETFPILSVSDDEKNVLKRLVQERRAEELVDFLKNVVELKGKRRGHNLLEFSAPKQHLNISKFT